MRIYVLAWVRFGKNELILYLPSPWNTDFKDIIKVHIPLTGWDVDRISVWRYSQADPS